ncbi:Transcriptional repressor XBP1 [Trametes pubescens]|uniref:Transcriptional repressor XBP1 n=1 Tax=Trametes pubescens TaxID=154538 RepID=A0A1M2W5E7_TRAPU|nr:Transcriptional repressor XBP1 [Trametes pubescens]
MALGASRSANMSSGLLLVRGLLSCAAANAAVPTDTLMSAQDPLPSPTTEPPANGTRFRPYASPDHHVTKARYITSNDPRGYIPVYEYPLNGQWIMLDMDDGYVLWTGIWKALGNSKADIVKIIDSHPDLAAQLRRVRGGYLKIQGTWMPYEIALSLARRVAWPIRYDLVPLFGPNFPDTCLHPDSPGYGQISKPGTGKRRTRRNPPPSELPSDSRHDWAVFSPGDAGPPSMGPPVARSALAMSHTFATHSAGRHFEMGDVRGDQSDSPVILHVPYVERPRHSPVQSISGGYSRRNSPPLEPLVSVRYSPYPSPLSATTSRHVHSLHGLGSAEISPTLSRPPTGRAALPIGETIKLPPIRTPAGRTGVDDGSFHLPPISSMDNLREAQCGEPMAVLRRLQCADEPLESSAPSSWSRPTGEMLAQRRHSLADPMHRRHGQADQQPRSAVDHSESTLASGARGHVARDDRLTQSMPPSPYLDAARRDYRICQGERHPPEAQERVFSRQERPLSPPPSATSGGSSPSDSTRPPSSWRPW